MNETSWTQKIWNDDKPSPKREVICRHCHARNRVLISKAVVEPEKFICAKCKKPIFLPKDEPLTGISSRSFEHKLDAGTLNTLRAIPGASTFIKHIFKNINERSYLYNLSTNAIRCSDEQFPELVHIVEKAAAHLDCNIKTKIFFTSMPFPNAFTTGGDEAILCFSTTLLNHLSDEELLFVTGHELGHLMSQHVISRFLLILLLNGGLQAMPQIARYLSMPIEMALLKWVRCSELTADRAGLLACRDLTTVLNCMLKVAAGNDPGVTERTTLSLPAFVEQAYELKNQDSSTLDSAVSAVLTRNQTHPFIAWRVLELIDWVENGNYFDIIAGNYV